MTGLVVNVAVLQNNRILLTQREDPETWILSSGGVEDGESIAQAALRETREDTEDTGLEVDLDRPDRHLFTPGQSFQQPYRVIHRQTYWRRN
jgi:ADP-ribose pyrophosphatase YjhB (NUDIX family)